MTDILGDELRGILKRAQWDWDIAKIEDRVRRKEATVQEVIDHVTRFEAENPRPWGETKGVMSKRARVVHDH